MPGIASQKASAAGPKGKGAAKAEATGGASDKINAALDAMFESAEQADVDAVVAAIAEAGVSAVNDSMFERLAAAAGMKKKKNARIAVSLLFSALIAKFGRSCEPYLHQPTRLFVVLELLGDGVKEVKEAALAALTTFRALLKDTPPTAAAMKESLLAGLETSKIPAQIFVLEWIEEISVSARVQLQHMLGDLIPGIETHMHSLKAEVQEAAAKTMASCLKVIDNQDVEPFIPALVAAMQEPTEVPETVHKLGSLTFVQPVSTACLSVIVPLLGRGFNDRNVAVVRCCAVICTNMARLVDVPLDALPFLDVLLPAVEKASNDVSNPECRATCGKCSEVLNRIKKAALSAPPRPSLENLVTIIHDAIADKAVADKIPNEINWSAHLALSLVVSNAFETAAWRKCISPFVKAAGLSEEVAHQAADKSLAAAEHWAEDHMEEEDTGDAEQLCNCKFTLAYGTKILLHNTTLKLQRGYRYGLLGGNDSGKSTLMRSMANGQIDGFPTDLRTVFVEADIQGEMSHLACIDYVFEDPRIKSCGASRQEVQNVLLKVGFSEKMCNDAITTLSGGWRMKLALARAMLQKADILLLDEPTNHLDVLNVAWVEDYLISLKDVTSIIVSHNSGLLDKCCTHMLHIEDLKLHLFKGNLSAFVDLHPKAQSFFELKSELSFKFPQPGYLEGVTSKGRALMKMENVEFTYPGNDKPTLSRINVQVCLASRVACVGVNGAGKSTMVKLLTGELEPCKGTVWQHQSARIAYVAQHAFHHIEKHLDKTANQYIAWRFANGEDKEALQKVTVVMTPEEEAKTKEEQIVEFPKADGSVVKRKCVISDIVDRRKMKQGNEYLVEFEGLSFDQNQWWKEAKLVRLGFAKILKVLDVRCEAREGMFKRPVTQMTVEQHLGDVGLAPEFATHTRMSALSGGQKVKVVLAAATWNQPHILILDEPTNYLDRESLGALANAIREYEGGVLMITHNNQFCSALCPETWVVEGGTLDVRGDAEWMKNALKEKVEFEAVKEMVDGSGNTIKVKQPKKKELSRKEKKERERRKKAAAAMGTTLSDETDEDDM
eukprot:JP445944.1.p1 GENE.JP445944.1~~JP445944.1.p1  ORF type:complete len:1063 (-),score=483.35 JP445944.1:201-3389(-)